MECRLPGRSSRGRGTRQALLISAPRATGGPRRRAMAGVPLVREVRGRRGLAARARRGPRQTAGGVARRCRLAAWLALCWMLHGSAAPTARLAASRDRDSSAAMASDLGRDGLKSRWRLGSTTTEYGPWG